REIESDKTLFLALSAPSRMKRDAQELGLRNIRYLEPTVDDLELSRFYNTVDALAHARADGETFGCVIAEAMMHGKPVVTHRSLVRNAQAELVDAACGFLVGPGDHKAYAEALRRLRDDADLKKRMGGAARAKALDQFEAAQITRKLEGLYLEE